MALILAAAVVLVNGGMNGVCVEGAYDCVKTTTSLESMPYMMSIWGDCESRRRIREKQLYSYIFQRKYQHNRVQDEQTTASK